eukprot:scaffold518_cov388-Prasinococcus_capsulatus_cf.AAC.55
MSAACRRTDPQRISCACCPRRSPHCAASIQWPPQHWPPSPRFLPATELQSSKYHPLARALSSEPHPVLFRVPEDIAGNPGLRSRPYVAWDEDYHRKLAAPVLLLGVTLQDLEDVVLRSVAAVVHRVCYRSEWAHISPESAARVSRSSRFGEWAAFSCRCASSARRTGQSLESPPPLHRTFGAPQTPGVYAAAG